MKLVSLASLGLLLGGFAVSGFSCTASQTATAQATVSAICAVAAAGEVAVQADGTILNVSSTTQAQIAAGAQLIPVQCALATQAVAAIAAASVASPTALVAVENEQASKLHISPDLLRKVIHRYAQ